MNMKPRKPLPQPKVKVPAKVPAKALQWMTMITEYQTECCSYATKLRQSTRLRHQADNVRALEQNSKDLATIKQDLEDRPPPLHFLFHG